MDDRERAAKAQEIERRIREGVPMEHIFPVVRRPRDLPPDPFADGHADFVASDIASPHGGTVMRSYLWDCKHVKSELNLMGYTPDRDGEVLGNMLRTARTRAAEAGKLCLCWPKGWAAQ